MRVTGARHGDAAALIFEAVGRLIVDRCRARFLLHARFKAAALDHEVLDHAVENRVVIMSGFDIGEEVGDRFRRLFGVQVEHDDAVVRGEFDHL